MKKYILTSLLVIISLTVKAQKSKDTTSSRYNKWTIEASVGQAKGVKPYSRGYYSGDPKTFLGKPQVNSLTLGARYMISPKFGFKADLHYNDLKNIKGSDSYPFEMKMIGFSIEGIVNASRLFDIEETIARFGILAHGGIRIDRMTSETANIVEHDHNYGVSEYNGGIIVGVTPQYRFSKKMSVYLDVTVQNNFRQHFNWDGSYSDTSNNLNGQIVTTSFGLTYSLGKNKLHGDWAIITDPNVQKLDDLNKKVSDIQNKMLDTDKDGVPDYLDQENNSVAGVAVDTRGRMVDLNRNGIPDELERYVDKTAKETVQKTTEDSVLRLVNEGYICAYFESGKAQSTDISTEGIDFMLTFLRNHPNSSIDIIGHADEIGKTAANNVLAKQRAESIKNTLIKAGINPSRLTVVSQGEDTSVAIDSAEARKLVRRVTFRVTK